MYIDNVFNIMSYVPDPCVMMFTENQVARMQWSIANHRPKMMAAYTVDEGDTSPPDATTAPTEKSSPKSLSTG
jgi:hypothetical protein